jgi:hypothetical protein
LAWDDLRAFADNALPLPIVTTSDCTIDTLCTEGAIDDEAFEKE